jgi:hypothetical protein
MPYEVAVSDFVERVCGATGQDEPHETLLRTYFAWQGPQHMPVDERLFRREFGLRGTTSCAALPEMGEQVQIS